jgi:hypothetical protein
MRFCPDQTRQLLTLVDPGRVRGGLAVGLRDGALLALIAAGLTATEVTTLLASAITTINGGQILVTVNRQGIAWSAALPTELGARLLAWLAERRLWGEAELVFPGHRGPLSPMAITKLVDRYRNLPAEPVRRKSKGRQRKHPGAGRREGKST